MSPRWFDGTDHLALDTGGGPLARLWSTALSGLVDIGYVKATGSSVVINLPRTALKPEVTFEWKIPQWSNALERNRARTYFQAYAAALALHFCEKALDEVRAGRTETWTQFEVPDEAISGRLHRGGARRAQPPHGDPGRARSRTTTPTRRPRGTAASGTATARPGPTRTPCRTRRSSRRTRRTRFKGIDIMRAVRSFDPCLPCGVHMYTGGGKVVEQLHAPSDAREAVLIRGRQRVHELVDHPEPRRPGRRAHDGATRRRGRTCGSATPVRVWSRTRWRSASTSPPPGTPARGRRASGSRRSTGDELLVVSVELAKEASCA